MKKKWCIKREGTIKEIGALSPLLMQLLANRGLREETAINGFLYGGLEDLEDPFYCKIWRRR